MNVGFGGNDTADRDDNDCGKMYVNDVMGREEIWNVDGDDTASWKQWHSLDKVFSVENSHD